VIHVEQWHILLTAGEVASQEEREPSNFPASGDDSEKEGEPVAAALKTGKALLGRNANLQVTKKRCQPRPHLQSPQRPHWMQSWRFWRPTSLPLESREVPRARDQSQKELEGLKARVQGHGQHMNAAE